ncbi:exo-alpha-sialidase [Cupriavidus sp. 2TAF22]|uniref:exo-alpha-sialidase n=1 Tax=unclassified Cupriavidus TaxID=2640874 RepID=UPI003F923651
MNSLRTLGITFILGAHIFLLSCTAQVVNGGPPGTVVSHRFASDSLYLGSPSIAKLRDGTIVISHDEFGPAASGERTFVYKSVDQGEHWSQAAVIDGQYWSSIFTFRNNLYLLGTTSDRGAPIIRKSENGGITWTSPDSARNGLFPLSGRYLSAPVPVLVHEGRLWRSMERVQKAGLESIVLSIPEDTLDLLNTSNWTISAGATPSRRWLDGRFLGWMEGNLVASASGHVTNILRVNYNDREEKAALVTVDSSGSRAEFNPETGFINLPGGGKKFTIRFDASSGYYLALSNAVKNDYAGGNYERARNRLSLIYSLDLHDWKVADDIIFNPDWNRHGYQYADWIFDGDDILTAVRVAADDSRGGAKNQHDSNYITFLKIKNFRKLLPK